MLACIEMLEKENQKLINIGKKEGKKEGIKQEKNKIIKNMKENNISIELISKITGMKVEEIKKIN